MLEWRDVPPLPGQVSGTDRPCGRAPGTPPTPSPRSSPSSLGLWSPRHPLLARLWPPALVSSSPFAPKEDDGHRAAPAGNLWRCPAAVGSEGVGDNEGGR